MNASLMAQRIHEERVKRGMSCAVLSELAGLSKNAVARYEDGSRIPTLFGICRLADARELALDYLTGRKSEKKL